MKVLYYPQPRSAKIIEAETPEAKADFVLARSMYCSISAGTEMGFYRGTAPQLNYGIDEHFNFVEKKDNIVYPMRSDGEGVWYMGYANVAEVIEVGHEVKGLKKGDIVFSKNGHKTHQLIRESAAYKLPATGDYEHYALSALVEIAFNGVLDSGMVLGETIAISGLGTLGQLILRMAKLSGCRVIGIDGLSSRLELARASGADAIVDFKKEDVCAAVYRETDGRGADVVFEVSGNEAALGNAVRAASYNGRIVVVSFYQGTPVDFHMGREFHHKRASLVCSQICGINPVLSARWTQERRMAAALELVPRLALDGIISHRIAFDELPSMLSTIDAKPSDCNAVIVKY